MIIYWVRERGLGLCFRRHFAPYDSSEINACTTLPRGFQLFNERIANERGSGNSLKVGNLRIAVIWRRSGG